MKRLLVAGAALALSVLPVAGVSASTGGDTGYGGSGTDIYASESEGYDVSKDQSSDNSSVHEAYVDKTVSYEALYYVKYDATLSAFVKDAQNASNNSSFQANYFNNSESQFSMPAFLAHYGVSEN